MPPIVFGVETEYAVSAFDRKGGRMRCVGDALISEATAVPHVIHSAGGGLFLHNGARLYVDRGDHPEYATPECADPWELVAHVRAGEQLMLDLAIRMRDRHGLRDVRIFRSNVDYLRPGTSWGAHESYSHRIDRALLPDHLIPHLVSRVICTGAGGLNPTSGDGSFAISPRVWLLHATTSRDTTSGRGIYHLKNETLANGDWNRLHLICGESLCSDRSLALKVGTTALVVAAIEAGARPGDGTKLASPLRAMRRFVSDPECRVTVPLAGGGRVSALDIQRHYLAEVERQVATLPDWATGICSMWREQLDELEASPAAANRSLDWAIKRTLFDRRIGTELDRGLLPEIPVLLRRLDLAARALRNDAGSPTPEEVLENGAPDAPRIDALRAEISAHGLRWSDFQTFSRVLHELRELDLRFGELDTGVFEALDRRGVLRHRLVAPDAIRMARKEPPASTRARLRGRAIRDLWEAGEARGHRADWSGIWNSAAGRWLDLGDPLGREPVWREGRRDPGPELPLFIRRRLAEFG